MAYADVPAFMIALRSRPALAARALEFAILTAARSGEVLGAVWSEIDLDRAVWTIPPQRMKAGKVHKVPLSPRALQILRALHEVRIGEFVFPGPGAGKPLSDIAMAALLRRMQIEGATVHGFRSSFRDWSAECTGVQNEVCEAALAHSIGNATEAAYRRSDLFDKRRGLMDAWAETLMTGTLSMAADAARIQRAVTSQKIQMTLGVTRLYEHAQDLILAGANDDELAEGVREFSHRPRAR